MKLANVIVSLVVVLGIVGCSKESDSPGEIEGLVPTTVARLETSPDFKLEDTTPSGIKCYVRELTPERARTIAKDTRDHHFLENHKQPYLLVFVCNDKIVDIRRPNEGNSTFTAKQSSELFEWGFKRAMKADGADKLLEATVRRPRLP